MRINKLISGVMGGILLGSALTFAAPVPKAQAGSSIDDGLVLYNSFDESTIQNNMVMDLSGESNHGTIVGGISFVEGMSGQAVYINNADEKAGKDGTQGDTYINYGDSISFGTNDFTASFWIKTDGMGVDNSAILSNKNYANGSNVGFAVGNFNNTSQRDVRINLNTTGNSRSDIYGIDANNDSWCYITVVFDRSAFVSVYVNGEKVKQTDISSHNGRSLDSGLDLVLGACGTKTNAVQRTAIDELRIYNRALSPDDVATLYTANAYDIILEHIESEINNLEPNYEYTAEMIGTIKEKINQTRQRILSAANLSQILTYISELQEAYQDFLKGSDPAISFFAISDIHTKGDINHAASQNFIIGLRDMARIAPDAYFLSAGDFTEFGSDKEVRHFYELLDEYSQFRKDRVLNVLGNHDVRGGSNWNDPNGSNPRWETGHWSSIYQSYMTENAPYMPKTDGKVYFARETEGYQFIALNTEKDYKDWADVSEEQAAWLDETLTRGDQSKPAFVILHQPLDETVWRSDAWSAGDDSNKNLREVFMKHPRVIFMSGHIHNGLGVTEAVEREYGTMVDLPSFNQTENGYRAEGIGFYVKVYEEAVVYKARNFVTGTWLPEYDIRIGLPTLAVSYGSAKELNRDNYTRDSWDSIPGLMEKAQMFFETKYEPVSWSVSSPPPKSLFPQEIRNQIGILSNEIVQAVNNLEKRGKTDTVAYLKKLLDTQIIGQENRFSNLDIELLTALTEQAMDAFENDNLTETQAKTLESNLVLFMAELRYPVRSNYNE